MRSLATKSALVAGAIALSISAFAEFSKPANADSVAAEAAVLIKAKTSIADIVKAGLLAGVTAEMMTTVLLSQATPAQAQEVIQAVLAAAPQTDAVAAAVGKAAAAANVPQTVITAAAANVPGVNITAVVPATAAGNQAGGNQAQGNQAGGNVGNANSAGNSSFGGAQGSTTSGGGGGGVSRS